MPHRLRKSRFAPVRIDGRRLSHAASTVIRRLAVERVEAGGRPSEVIAQFGLCRTTIYRWLRAARAGGLSALAARPHPGPPPRLSDADALRVREWILGRLPRDQGIAAALWTRRAVRELVRLRLGVELSEAAIGRLLRRIRLRPRKAVLAEEQGTPVVVFAVDRRGAFLCDRLADPPGEGAIQAVARDLLKKASRAASVVVVPEA